MDEALAAVGLALAALPIAGALWQGRAARLLKRGLALLDRAEYASALPPLRRAFEISQKAWLMRDAHRAVYADAYAAALMGIGDHEAAAPLVQQGLAFAEASTTRSAALAFHYKRAAELDDALGRPLVAEHALKKAVALPDVPFLQWRALMERIAILRKQRGDLAGALETYGQIIHHSDEDAFRASILTRVALLKRRTGDLSGANDTIDAALSTAPALSQANLRLMRAELRVADQRFDEAAADFEHVLSHLGDTVAHPAAIRARLGCARIAVRRGDQTRAEALCREAIVGLERAVGRIAPASDHPYRTTHTTLMPGDLDEARAFLESILRRA